MMLRDIPLESTPPETGMLVYEKAREITGEFDPYKELKIESAEKALALYPSLKRIVEQSNDVLLTAIRMAIAGNVIDFGPNKDFAIYDYDKFKDGLDKTTEILYLGDNAGEAVFDRSL
jgi:uncharacterized protein with ATP-grasp and redox domains